MSTGWLALAVLLLATAKPGADDVVHINQRAFKIPIKVLPERRHEVKELILWLSRDQGRTWEIYGKATPDKDGFDFLGASDGLFYFSIAVIDKRGQMDPPDVYRAPVGQKILIDSTKPVVKLVSAERLGDEVQVSWTVQEDRPERESLKLEYKVGDSPTGQWTPLAIEFGPRGNLRFRPGLPGPLTLRLSLRDVAGNEGVDEKVVGGSPRQDNALVHAGATTPAPSDLPPPPPSPPPFSQPEPSARAAMPNNSMPAPLATTSTPPATQAPLSSQPVHSSGGTMPTRGSLPPLQIVNKRNVKLGFDVTRFGPSGLGSVDVYVTSDEGATWEKSPSNPNVTLPVTAEVRGAQPVRGSVTVSLPRDGQIYGFYLVVKNRAGLGKAPPRTGDPPQIRIELDTEQPVAELYRPTADTVRRDCLVMSWKATDRNLAPNPISLEWSARAEGPWTFIGDAQLANTGRYLWQVPENTPAKVFLRLSVRDTAGNTAIAQTPEPVVIDITPPEIGDVKLQLTGG